MDISRAVVVYFPTTYGYTGCHKYDPFEPNLSWLTFAGDSSIGHWSHVFGSRFLATLSDKVIGMGYKA